MDEETEASSMATQVGKKKERSKFSPKNWPMWTFLIIGVVVLAVIAAIAFLVYNATKSEEAESQPLVVQTTTNATTKRPAPKKEECPDIMCTNHAYAMLNAMKIDANPCASFHNYACGNYNHTEAQKPLFSTKKIKDLLNKAKPDKDPIGIAKKLYELCQPAKVTLESIGFDRPPERYDGTIEAYVNELAMEGYTNFGVFKLDMSRLTDPNGVNPKTVLVLQDPTYYDNNRNFGFKITENDNFYKYFDRFDDSKNTIKTEEKDLVLLERIMNNPNVPPLKKNTVKEVVKGWFPAGTPNYVMFSNVWTFKYDYWTKPLDKDVKTDNLEERRMFHKTFASKELQKSMLSAMPTSSKDCHTLVFNMIPQAFTDSKKFPKKSRGTMDPDINRVELLFKQYKMQYHQEILNFTMTEAERTDIAQRLYDFKILYGYPQKWKDNLAKDIGKIDYGKMNDIHTAYIELKKWQLHQHFAHLADPLKHFPAYPSFYNQKMWYHFESNTLYIWPTFVEDEYFPTWTVRYMALGGFGHLIGKAMSDAIGHQARDEQKYRDGVNCYEENVKTNPYGFSKELVADHIAARVAYQVVKMDEQRTDDRHFFLYGMESWPNDKLYFLSLAKHFCEAPLDGLTTLHKKLTLEEVAYERLNGLAMNMPEFAKTFGCNPREPMYHPNQCVVYR